jgi:hypothetical protein
MFTSIFPPDFFFPSWAFPQQQSWMSLEELRKNFGPEKDAFSSPSTTTKNVHSFIHKNLCAPPPSIVRPAPIHCSPFSPSFLCLYFARHLDGEWRKKKDCRPTNNSQVQSGHQLTKCRYGRGKGRGKRRTGQMAAAVAAAQKGGGEPGALAVGTTTGTEAQATLRFPRPSPIYYNIPLAILLLWAICWLKRGWNIAQFQRLSFLALISGISGIPFWHSFLAFIYGIPFLACILKQQSFLQF